MAGNGWPSLLVFLRSSMDYGSSYCLGWVSERVINDMRIEVLHKFSTLSLDFFNRSKTGDLLTRINSDTAKLQNCLKNGTADIIKESVSIIGVIAMLLWLNWHLTLFALVFLPAGPRTRAPWHEGRAGAGNDQPGN